MRPGDRVFALCLAAAASAILMPSIARAENWLEVGRAEGVVVAVDSESLKTSDATLTAKFLSTLAEQPYAPALLIYVVMDTEIDCAAGVSRKLGGQVYVSNGSATRPMGEPIPGDTDMRTSHNSFHAQYCANRPGGAGAGSAGEFLSGLLAP